MTTASTFTLTAWVRDATDMVFSLTDGTPRNRLQFEVEKNSLLYGWAYGPQFDEIRGRVPGWNKGQWYHVALSISGGTVALYRDGQFLISRSYGQKINSKTVTLIDVVEARSAHIGFLHSNHKNVSQNLGGQIDDIQIYRQALDSRAIRYLYEHPGQTWVDSAMVFNSQ